MADTDKDAETNGTNQAKKLKKIIRSGIYIVGGLMLLGAVTFLAYANFSATGSISGKPRAEQVASQPVPNYVVHPPVVAHPYVWDGNWNHVTIPAGVDEKSEVVEIEDNTRPYLGSGYGSVYDFVCVKRVKVEPEEGFSEVPCSDKSDHYFQLVNKTSMEVDAKWHPGPR